MRCCAFGVPIRIFGSPRGACLCRCRAWQRYHCIGAVCSGLAADVEMVWKLIVVRYCLDSLDGGAPMEWQVQEAKQRFSELVRRATSDGPQTVTRHGQAVAVVVSAEEYERLTKPKVSFKDYLLSGPDLSELDLTRQKEYPREIEL